MSRRFRSLGGAALLALVLAAPAVAQGPPGGGGPGGPGGGFNMAAMQKFRDQHKYTFQLQRMLRGFEDLNKDASTALTPAQAKGVLGLLKPWQTKPKMTQDDAKNLMKGVKKVLTVKQLNALSRIQDRGPGGGGRGGGFGGPGGPGGGGPPGGGPAGGGFGGPPGGPGGGGPAGGFRAGGPGGGPGGRGGGRGFDPAAMKNFNPLLVKADPNNRFQMRRVERNKRMFASLAQRAAGKTTTAKK